MRFSQRIGKRQIKTVLQVDSMDTDLRNRIWNSILEDFIGNLSSYNGNYEESDLGYIYRLLWKEFFNYPMDKLPTWNSGIIKVDTSDVQDMLRDWFYKAEWFEVYDLLEFFSSLDNNGLNISFDEKCNRGLKKELSAFRVIKGKVVQITSEEEILEIEQAINDTNVWKSVNTHLVSALELLADRKNPHFRNSIKESISAVEALCKIITGNSSATLGEGLTLIEKKHFLHAALKKSFSSLYGYTSDSSGIRHALLENDTEVGFEEAKFMLVSCSAFINYLKSKHST
jgi:hypothetical protein